MPAAVLARGKKRSASPPPLSIGNKLVGSLDRRGKPPLTRQKPAPPALRD